MKNINTVAQHPQNFPAASKDANRFLTDLKDPNSLASLIHNCLQEADTTKNPVAYWANRAESGKVLQTLVEHPALQ